MDHRELPKVLSDNALEAGFSAEGISLRLCCPGGGDGRSQHCETSGHRSKCKITHTTDRGRSRGVDESMKLANFFADLQRSVVFLAVAAASLGCGSAQVSTAEPAKQPATVAKPVVRPVVKPITFPLEYQIIDPDNAKNAAVKPGEKKLPPLIVMFPGGKTDADKDATGPIGRLESFRGKSKLFPDSNDDPGLPVLLSGLRFLERRDSAGKLQGYDVELQGEFNAVKVAAPDDAMKDFLAGKKATFSLESRLDYGIIATVSTTKLEISRTGDKLTIHSVDGDFSFREAIFTYKSPSLKKSPPPGRTYLYQGEVGKLPELRIL
jgi:hypothetical protein